MGLGEVASCQWGCQLPVGKFEQISAQELIFALQRARFHLDHIDNCLCR
jgi:hypothetical protein